MVGSFDGRKSKPMLISTTFVDQTNNKTINQCITDLLRVIWPENMHNDLWLWLILPSMKHIFFKIKGNKNISFENCGKSTFYSVMRRMAIKYAKVQELKSKALMGRNDIIIKRRNFLKEKRRFEIENEDLLWVYLYETFIHKNLVTNKMIVKIIF
jgi:hypothetical protein